MTPPRLGPEDETLVTCPADEACAACDGTGRIMCFRCPLPHKMECPGCSTCGLCQGLGVVSAPRRREWLRLNPPKDLPK